LETVVSKCGMVVAPNDDAAFAAAVCSLADNSALRGELGRRARNYAETNFERDAILGRLFGPAVGEESRVANDAIA
jgi:colanic acid biosynthesis glycosyl transferase WcaI